VSRWVHGHTISTWERSPYRRPFLFLSPRHNASAAPRSPRARKALGQHFLVDQSALDRIAAAAEIARDESVLEIGAGTGELTQALSNLGTGIAAVEVDEALCRVLRARFGPDSSVHVLNANILDYVPVDLLTEAGLFPPYAVVANIPYYITAPILRRFLEAAVKPRRLILTVQREVAESIAAGPGGMSLLGVSVQFYGSARVLFRLPPHAFRPPPKVESAVLRIDVLPEPFLGVGEQAGFFKVVRAGFRAPRKQLHNAISQGLWLPPGEAAPMLEAAGIDPLRRAQTLSLQEWAQLTRAYIERRPRWAQAPHTSAEGAADSG
jgi:16S rRNA (adenine1518-N6/adenine1519-N6)-dimethyltransferase